jgi:hypothetical protein
MSPTSNSSGVDQVNPEEISMYTAHQRDQVHELTDVPSPAAGAPNPLVLADERTLVVAYISATPINGPTDRAGQPSAQDSAGLVVFKQCYATHFGLPNDEAFASHPLVDRGLRPYGAFEVENSSWVSGLEMRNRGHPRHDPEVFLRLRHWVWTFQDSVLECAALSYAAEEGQGGPTDLLDRMQGLLRSG